MKKRLLFVLVACLACLGAVAPISIRWRSLQAPKLNIDFVWSKTEHHYHHNRTKGENESPAESPSPTPLPRYPFYRHGNTNLNDVSPFDSFATGYTTHVRPPPKDVDEDLLGDLSLSSRKANVSLLSLNLHVHVTPPMASSAVTQQPRWLRTCFLIAVSSSFLYLSFG